MWMGPVILPHVCKLGNERLTHVLCYRHLVPESGRRGPTEAERAAQVRVAAAAAAAGARCLLPELLQPHPVSGRQRPAARQRQQQRQGASARARRTQGHHYRHLVGVFFEFRFLNGSRV